MFWGFFGFFFKLGRKKLEGKKTLLPSSQHNSDGGPLPFPPAAVCRSSPVCAIKDRIYCVENQAVRADEAPSAWLGRGSGEDTGQALSLPWH